jgi:EAL and modified HD-GYP domain-containing signal transduction protein
MGQSEMKKFISLLTLANLGDDKPIELIHLSLVRAKFYELIGQAKLRADNPHTAFLVELFSLLDALLDQTMPVIVEKLPVNENIKSALCGDESELRQFLALIMAFEAGNWNEIDIIAKRLSIDLEKTQALYNESLKWALQ